VSAQPPVRQRVRLQEQAQVQVQAQAQVQALVRVRVQVLAPDRALGQVPERGPQRALVLAPACSLAQAQPPERPPRHCCWSRSA
jgi:hypothetical protein